MFSSGSSVGKASQRKREPMIQRKRNEKIKDLLWIKFLNDIEKYHKNMKKGNIYVIKLFGN